MDHVTVAAVVRTPTGPDAATLEVGLVDEWVTIEPTEAGGPTFTVDVCTWWRLVAAGALLGV